MYGRGDITGNGGFDDISHNPNSYQNYGHPSQADYARLTQIIGTNIDKISQHGKNQSISLLRPKPFLFCIYFQPTVLGGLRT